MNDAWRHESHVVRRQRWDATKIERYRAVLAQLRSAFAEGERELVGWPEIVAWLQAHRVRRVGRRPVTITAARLWMRCHDMPVLRGAKGLPGLRRSSGPWTTNYLLSSWLVSLYNCHLPRGPRVIYDAREGTQE